jgi:hypothetical protein
MDHRPADASPTARNALLERMAEAEQVVDIDDMRELPDVADLEAAWPKLSMEAKRLALTAVIDRIVISPAPKIGVLTPAVERVTIDWR